MRLIVATQNESKLQEIKHILKGVKLQIVSLNDLDREFHLRENGKTFFDNAVKKTLPVSKSYGDDLVVGEDSGLEVKRLGGKPGIYSKRYSGKNWTHEKNNQKILRELDGVKRSKRRASFHCCLVLFKGGKLVKKIDGRLNGYISNEQLGNQGFGYDPIFYVPKYRKTVAQLSSGIKNRISHRAIAFRTLKTSLLNNQIY